MEKLLSVMIHRYFDIDLWKMFAELSYFYRQLCAKQVSKTTMQKFEKEILILVCKMEKVFPPGWFNAMQHLLVYLSWEAKVGGPVQFRWMYSQERELKKLRATMHNKGNMLCHLRRGKKGKKKVNELSSSSRPRSDTTNSLFQVTISFIFYLLFFTIIYYILLICFVCRALH
jgi:hypothetical protein